MAKCTVIMSVYNDELYLEESIKSILTQSFNDFYFYIVDDCSNDSSYSILKKFEAVDNRITVFKNLENKGLAYNLNFLINKSITPFLARMDADDISLKSRLEKQYKKIIDTDADVVWTNAIIIDKESDIICSRYQPTLEFSIDNLLYYNYIVHPSVFYKREVLLDVGGYNSMERYGQDYTLWKKLKKEGARFELINEMLIKYRILENSNTSKSIGYPKNKNVMFAEICLKNRDKDRFKFFYNKIDSTNIRYKIILIFRLIIGENNILLMRKLLRIFNVN